MFAGLFLAPVLVLGFLFLASVAVVVGIMLAIARTPGPAADSEVTEARRHQTLTSLLAIGALLITPPMLWVWGTLARFDSRLVMVGAFPLVASMAALVVLLLGELTWPRPAGATRVAVLNDRSVPAVLAGRWWRTYAAALTALIVVSLAGGLLADGHGTTIVVSHGGFTGSAGPFPGWPYVVPQLVAAAVAAVVVALVVSAATRRASVLSTDRDTDLVLRRASAGRALRAATVGVLFTIAGDLLFGGAAARRALDVGWQRDLALAVVLLGLLCLVGALAGLLAPVPRPRPNALAPAPPTVRHPA